MTPLAKNDAAMKDACFNFLSNESHFPNTKTCGELLQNWVSKSQVIVNYYICKRCGT